MVSGQGCRYQMVDGVQECGRAAVPVGCQLGVSSGADGVVVRVERDVDSLSKSEC